MCVRGRAQMLSSLGPCMLLLEGGYNLAATAACTAECVPLLGLGLGLGHARTPPAATGDQIAHNCAPQALRAACLKS